MLTIITKGGKRVNTKANQTTINIQEKSSLIWSIADLIRENYKPHEYGKVILPMTVI